MFQSETRQWENKPENSRSILRDKGRGSDCQQGSLTVHTLAMVL